MRHPSLFVFLALLVCGGVAFGEPMEIAPQLRGATQPQLTVAPDGRVHVVFGVKPEIFHASSADGRSFTTPVKVGELQKLGLGMRRGPRVAATGEVITITAISHADGDLHNWISTDGGASWERGGRINGPERSAREGMHAMAGDCRGFVFVTWLDLRSGGMEVWSSTSSDGGRTWSENRKVYASPDGAICTCCPPNAAVAENGVVAVTWRNSIAGSRDLWMTTSTDGGQSFDPAQKLGTGTWKLEGCPMDGGGLAFDAEGNPVSVWRREGTVFQTTPSETEALLAQNAAQPSIAFAGNEAFVVWEQDGDVFLKQGAAAPARLAAKAGAAAIAALPDGSCIVAWEDRAGEHPRLMTRVIGQGADANRRQK